jgi:glycosyltransferase 2 family protein
MADYSDKSSFMNQFPIRYRRFIIIGVLALLVLGIIIIFLDRNNIAGVISKANWIFAGIALITTGISYCFECFNYVILNRLFNVNPGFGPLFLVGYVSITIGNLISTPFGFTEHSIRAILLVPRGYKSGDVVAASMFHSYIKDVTILALAPGVIFYQLLTENLPDNVVRILMIVAILASMLLIVFSLMFLSKVIRGFILRVLAGLTRLIIRRYPEKQIGDFDFAIERAKSELRKHPTTGFILLGFSFADWILVLVTVELCFIAFGLVIPFTSLTSGFVVGKTAGLLSLIPGGIGVQDASTGAIYSLLGTPFSVAILVFVLFRVIYHFVPYFISFPLLRSLLRDRSKKR